jgi:hypothetical protein
MHSSTTFVFLNLLPRSSSYSLNLLAYSSLDTFPRPGPEVLVVGRAGILPLLDYLGSTTNALLCL